MTDEYETTKKTFSNKKAIGKAVKGAMKDQRRTMSKLKFRVWVNNSHPHYEYDFVMTSNGEVQTVYSIKFTHNKKCTIEQCTGLKDKNGREIYEGDILHAKPFDNPEETRWEDDKLEVVYDENNACYRALNFGVYRYKGESFDFDEMKEFEIVGNIHENPELIASNSTGLESESK